MKPTQGMHNANSMDSVVNEKEESMIRDENDAVYLGQREVYDNRTKSFGLKQGTWNGNNYSGQNEGDDDYSFAPQQTEINDIKTETAGSPGNGYSRQEFSQCGADSRAFGLSTLQGRTDSSTQYGDVIQASDEDITRDFFTSNSVEDGLIVKPPFSDVKDNYKSAEQMAEQYEDEITVAVEMAKDIVPSVVLEIADKAVPFLPPHLQGGARGVLIAIDIGLAVYEVYDEWDAEVELYAKQHGCSREVAEQKVSLAKKVHDAFMIFSTHKWLQYVMRSAGHPADLKITVGVEVLDEISEEDIKEWRKMITE